ncbi:hypothetical protein Tco_0256618 [Tanacetum coccineum]
MDTGFRLFLESIVVVVVVVDVFLSSQTFICIIGSLLKLCFVLIHLPLGHGNRLPSKVLEALSVTFPSILLGNPDESFQDFFSFIVCGQYLFVKSLLNSVQVILLARSIPIDWAYAFHQDKASSVRVPVANVTLFSHQTLLRENTDLVRSNQRMSSSMSGVPVGIASTCHCGEISSGGKKFSDSNISDRDNTEIGDTTVWWSNRSMKLDGIEKILSLNIEEVRKVVFPVWLGNRSGTFVRGNKSILNIGINGTKIRWSDEDITCVTTHVNNIN